MVTVDMPVRGPGAAVPGEVGAVGIAGRLLETPRVLLVRLRLPV